MGVVREICDPGVGRCFFPGKLRATLTIQGDLARFYRPRRIKFCCHRREVNLNAKNSFPVVFESLERKFMNLIRQIFKQTSGTLRVASIISIISSISNTSSKQSLPFMPPTCRVAHDVSPPERPANRAHPPQPPAYRVAHSASPAAYREANRSHPPRPSAYGEAHDAYPPAYREAHDAYPPAYREAHDAYPPAYREAHDPYPPAHREAHDAYPPVPPIRTTRTTPPTNRAYPP